MYECEGDIISNPGDDMMSGHSALSDKSGIDTHYFGDRFHTLSPRASCQSPDLSSQILECLDGNSSLGNHSQDLGSLEVVTTAKVAPTPKLPKNLQSNTANTRIVGGEIQESKTNSESSLSDSHSLLESSLKDSCCISESILDSHSHADSNGISKSTLLDSQSISKHTSKAYRHILAFYLYFTHKRGYYAKHTRIW